MPPAVSVKDRVTAMTRDVLGPMMKGEGFRRTGRVFWRDGVDVCQVVHVQMSRWGTHDDSSFDIHLGVYWHAVEKLVADTPAGKMPPPIHHCTFQIDLGQLLSFPPKPSWKVTASSDFERTGREAADDLQRYGLPWLDRRSDLRRVLEIMHRPGSDGTDDDVLFEMLGVAAKAVFRKMLRSL